MFCWQKTQESKAPSDHLSKLFAVERSPYTSSIALFLDGRSALRLSEANSFFSKNKTISLELRRQQGRKQSLHNEIKNIETELKPLHAEITQAILDMPDVYAKEQFAEIYVRMKTATQLHDLSKGKACLDLSLIAASVVCVASSTSCLTLIAKKMFFTIPKALVVCLPFTTTASSIAVVTTGFCIPGSTTYTWYDYLFALASYKSELFQAFREFRSVVRVYRISKHPAELEKELQTIYAKTFLLTQEIRKIAVQVERFDKKETKQEEAPIQNDAKSDELISPITSQLGL